jgi:hypothetical protein
LLWGDEWLSEKNITSKENDPKGYFAANSYISKSQKLCLGEMKSRLEAQVRPTPNILASGRKVSTKSDFDFKVNSEQACR